MTISSSRSDLTSALPDSAELLIKEAQRASRRRRMRNGAILFAALLVATVAGAITFQVERGNVKTPRIGTGTPKKSPPVMTIALPLKARIWTLDMLNDSSGFAVAGVASKTRDESLIETTNMGKSWSVVGSLPYSFNPLEYKPLLHFVTPLIGYTQAFQAGTTSGPQNVYVTTNGGVDWTTLKISGEVPSNSNAVGASTSPDFRISRGVVSLISLKCSASVDFQTSGTCPAVLSEYRWGARQPFTTHPVVDVDGGASGKQHSEYLLAAPSAKTALVAEGPPWSSSIALALTRDGGATWTRIENPCTHGRFPDGTGMSISGVTITPSRWILNCTQGTGMNHGTVLLSESANDGHTWTTLNYTPSGSGQSGGIGNEIDQVWTSNGGNVLWSYSSLGYRQVSTDGGRTWEPISVNGRLSNDNTGGGPIQFDPVGKSGAYFVTQTGQLFLSRDGQNFTPVRLLHKS